MPIHTIQRDPRYFKEPLKFMPERWLDENAEEWIRDKRAFMPFSTGTYKCIGNNLAMMEMRVVVSNLVRRFNVKPAEGEDFRRIEKETMDTFTLCMGALSVVLTRRSPKERKDSVGARA
jgi:cytochrome P450 family 628